ncbi:MAG: pimeloyl-ACP methyl ester esterase BioH [Betaproteobacteria bacterium]|nr:pimeloyl-ACP methyl ester esterase BioH [Betaproteobacteria bacterium]
MAECCYLHGWGLHGGIWAETRALLPGDAPDLPGYGATPTVTPYTVETVADAVAASLDGPVDLIGWSMGGMTALALAARHPDKVRRLVLVGASPCFVNRPGWGHGLDAEVVTGFSQSLAQDYKTTLQRFLALQARGDDEARAVISRLREKVLAHEPRPDTLAAGMDLLQQADLRDVLEAVLCPTLVVHGAYDALCPVAAGRWLAAYLPDAALAEHPRASHAPFLSHPAWFVETVTEFLHG